MLGFLPLLLIPSGFKAAISTLLAGASWKLPRTLTWGAGGTFQTGTCPVGTYCASVESLRVLCLDSKHLTC